MKKIGTILQLYKKNSATHNKLISEVLNDLEIISNVVPILQQKLYSKENSSSSFDYSTSPDTDRSTKSLDVRLIDIKETSDKGAYLINPTVLGNLIPLTCGHNGTLRPNEIEVYEYHLKVAKIIS